MRAAGFNVTSVDLRYRLDKAEILDEFEKAMQRIVITFTSILKIFF